MKRNLPVMSGRSATAVPVAIWALTCAAATAQAADWQKIATDGDGNVYTLDLQTLVRDRGEVTGVVRNEYAEPRHDDAIGKPIFAALDRLVVNCETAAFALQSRTLVAADGSEVPTLAATRDQLRMRAATPGSLSETIVRSLCRAAQGR